MIQPRETSPLCNHVYTHRSSGAYSKTVIFITLVTFCFVVPVLTFLCGVYLSDHAPEPHPYWNPPTSEEHCHSYGTREYTARLINLSWKYDKILWCERTPIVIHNVTFERPDFCEVGYNHRSPCRRNGTDDLPTFQTSWGDVYGHWLVNVQEYKCLPYWSPFRDEVRASVRLCSI